MGLDVSWFTIMDQIGKWTCDGADRLIDRGRDAIDLAQGVRSRRQRQEAVADFRKGLGNKPPLRIEPKITQPKTGARIYKEKQTAIPIFVEDRVPEGCRFLRYRFWILQSHSAVVTAKMLWR